MPEKIISQVLQMHNMYISDLPITKSKDDLLGRSQFSANLGQSLIDWTDEASIVVGLYGEWGSGKSSVINLSCEYIQDLFKGKRKKPIIVYFNPWNFSEQEKLVSTFLHELAKSISHTDSSKTAKKVGEELIAYSHLFSETLRIPLELAVSVTPYGHILLPVVKLIGKVFKQSGEATKSWGELKEKTVEQYKDDLSKYIRKLNRKIIVVIDDIDRLNNKEVRQIFQLVKQNASFPGLIYLLPFDRGKVAKALDREWFPGDEYLEKIVQIPFDIPTIEQVKLDRLLTKELNRIIKPFPQTAWDQKHWLNIYYGGLQPFFSSIRQIKRFVNSIEFNLLHIPDEVNLVDFTTLEVIRVFVPKIYGQVWKNKRVFTELESNYVGSQTRDTDKRRQKINEIIELASVEHRKSIKIVLEKLFPQIGSGYTSDWLEEWNKKKRICSEERFDRYFLLEIPENEVSQKEIDSIIKASNSSSKVEKHLLNLEKDNKAKNFLEKLVMYKDDVPENNILSFVIGVINAGEKLPNDSSGMAILDTVSWCVRVVYHLFKRINSRDERLSQTIKLIEQANSIDVLSRYISIEIRREEDSKNDHEYIIDKKNIPVIKEKMVSKIRNYAKAGKLTQSSNLAYLLYFWVFLANKKEVKQFVEKLIESDDGLAVFVTGFMWRQSSQSMGDYVSVNTWKINIKSMKEFIAPKSIKVRAGKLIKKKTKLTEKQLLALEIFVEEMDKKDEK